MSKRIKIIFTLSLLLNLVLIGIGGGMFYRFTMEGPVPGDMTPEARHFMARTFQEGRDRVRPLIGDIKEKRAKVEKTMIADKFDINAYNAAVAEMMTSRDRIARERAEIMGEALVDLPLEDRKRLAKHMLDGLTGKRPHRKGFHQKMMEERKDAVPSRP